jgi:hypothetical protein
MSATQDKTQKFKFDWNNNFYLLWKRGEFSTESTAPVVIVDKKEEKKNERSESV